MYVYIRVCIWLYSIYACNGYKHLKPNVWYVAYSVGTTDPHNKWHCLSKEMMYETHHVPSCQYIVCELPAMLMAFGGRGIPMMIQLFNLNSVYIDACTLDLVILSVMPLMLNIYAGSGNGGGYKLLSTHLKSVTTQWAWMKASDREINLFGFNWFLDS